MKIPTPESESTPTKTLSAPQPCFKLPPHIHHPRHHQDSRADGSAQRQLHYYLSYNHLLSPAQHGFRPRHSTETALTCVTDSILSATDSGQISILCLIDLSKCFDVISHSKLIEQLQLLGVDTSWFQNYLSGHTQSVSLTSYDRLTVIFFSKTCSPSFFTPVQSFKM